MKTEQKISDGHFYGLSPKCYIMQSKNKIKLSTKGVPRSIDLRKEDFMKCLYKNDAGSVSYHHLMISKKTNEAITRKTTKVALNNLYFKMHVDSNKVTVRPHKKDGKWL